MYNEQSTKIGVGALPAYFGGKRKILPNIFNSISPDAKTLLDPMAGACTVPLAAKISGMSVTANDHSFGSSIIGEALIVNESTLIDQRVLPALIKPVDGCDKYLETTFGDWHLPVQLAVYADNIHHNIQTIPTETQAPYRLMLYRFLTFMAPYNLYRYPGLTKGFLQGTYPTSMQGHITKWEKNIADPLPALEKIAKQINAAVFPGVGNMLQDDVFKVVEENTADVLYFDPPYAGAGIPYERGYEVIEQMITRTDVVRGTSVFNDLSLERDSLRRVLSAEGYKQIIFSYWTELHDRDWFSALFDEANLDSEEILLGNYNYSYSTKKGKKGDWTSDKKKGSKEIMYKLTPR